MLINYLLLEDLDELVPEDRLREEEDPTELPLELERDVPLLTD